MLSPATTHAPVVRAAAPAASVPACDDVHYWPAEQLDAFALQMASHGRCVSIAMMLGDRGYAMEQLAVAQSTACPVLRGLATQLCNYFASGHSATPAMAWN